MDGGCAGASRVEFSVAPSTAFRTGRVARSSPASSLTAKCSSAFPSLTHRSAEFLLATLVDEGKVFVSFNSHFFFASAANEENGTSGER